MQKSDFVQVCMVCTLLVSICTVPQLICGWVGCSGYVVTHVAVKVVHWAQPVVLTHNATTQLGIYLNHSEESQMASVTLKKKE